MTDQPDYSTLSGGQFANAVGDDPEKWAAAFIAAYAKAEGVQSDAARQAFVAGWFRDAQQAAVNAELGRVTLQPEQ